MVEHSCYGMGVLVVPEMGVEDGDGGQCLKVGYMVFVPAVRIVARVEEWAGHNWNWDNWNWEYHVGCWVYPVDMRYGAHLPEEF